MTLQHGDAEKIRTLKQQIEDTREDNTRARGGIANVYFNGRIEVALLERMCDALLKMGG